MEGSIGRGRADTVGIFTHVRKEIEDEDRREENGVDDDEPYDGSAGAEAFGSTGIESATHAIDTDRAGDEGAQRTEDVLQPIDQPASDDRRTKEAH